jgi:ATP-dependent protease HslVU (ClpYQ) peptidase subunit
MTCIVGLKHEKTLYFGSDSASSTDAGYLTSLNRSKVFKTGSILIGVAGSSRLSQVLEHRFVPPKITSKTEKYLCTQFIDRMKACLNKHAKGADFELLIGIHGRIFVIFPDWQVEEAIDDFHAIGSGKDIARGAMYAAQDKSPEDRIRLALEAAEKFNNGVCSPFRIESIDFSSLSTKA